MNVFIAIALGIIAGLVVGFGYDWPFPFGMIASGLASFCTTLFAMNALD